MKKGLNIYKINIFVCILILYFSNSYATSIEETILLENSSVLSTDSNSGYKDNLNNSIEVDNINNVQDAENNDSIRINGRTSLDELKEAVGYTGDEDLSEMVDSAAVGNMLSDLMNELRPYLTDVISVDADGYYVFSSKEIINIIAKHPIKFLVAIYNYTVHMINETFKIATENAIVDVEVK